MLPYVLAHNTENKQSVKPSCFIFG
jgi:hypothetical protein